MLSVNADITTSETRVLIGCNAGNREIPASCGRVAQTAAAYRLSSPYAQLADNSNEWNDSNCGFFTQYLS